MTDRDDEPKRGAAAEPEDTIDEIESGPIVGLPTAAGPLHDDVKRREITARIHQVADTATREAFKRGDERLEAVRAELAALAKEMRDRDHAVRNDLSARIEDLSADVRRHVEADLALHTELVGRQGNNGRLGALAGRVAGLEATAAAHATIQSDHGKRLDRDHSRLGSLEGSRSAASKVLVAVAGGAIGALVTAVIALTSASRKSGFDDAERAQVVEAVKANTAQLAVIKAVLYARGLLTVPDGAMSLPSIAPDHGDTP